MSANGNLAHAFLFTGPEGVGKLEFARKIALYLQNPTAVGSDPTAEAQNHPDIMETPTPLPIDEAKALKKRLYTSPFSGKYKIVIISDAHNMHTDAVNSLLKMIEEPRGDTIFILSSAYPELILETMRSRCFEIKFAYVPDELIEKGFDTKNIQDLKLHWTGRPAFVKRFIEDESYYKRIKQYKQDLENFMHNSLSERFNISEKYGKIEDKVELLDALRVWMENTRVQEFGDKKVLEDIFNIYKNTISTNANVRYALNNLAVSSFHSQQ